MILEGEAVIPATVTTDDGPPDDLRGLDMIGKRITCGERMIAPEWFLVS